MRANVYGTGGGGCCGKKGRPLLFRILCDVNRYSLSIRGKYDYILVFDFNDSVKCDFVGILLQYILSILWYR